MRAQEFISTPVLLEGGNIWKNELATSRINRADVIPTVRFLEKITGLPLVDRMLGSTGRKDTSGDLDLAVDANLVDKSEIVAKLSAWAKAHDSSALVKKTGVSVHFRTPINGNPDLGYVQTDFMFMPDVEFALWSMAAFPSAYRGEYKHIVLASIAKFLGLKWSFRDGLIVRDSNTPLTQGKDPDYVAKILLGPNATASDITTVESIINALANDPDRDEKLADARELLSSRGITI